MKRRLYGAIIIGLSVAAAIGSPMAMAKKRLTWYVSGITWKALAAQFMKRNPDAEIRMLTGNMDKFYSMTTAGQMPDIWGPWDTPGVSADALRGWALDLTPYLKRDAKEMDLNDFFPGVMKGFRVNGKLYSLPFFNYVDYYFYNTDLYGQAGIQPPPLDAGDRSWNWDRMVGELKKITRIEPEGKMSVSGLGFTRDSHSPAYYHMWNAEPYSKDDLATSIPRNMYYGSPDMQQGLQAMWDLIYKYRISAPTNLSFETGKSGATIEPGYYIGGYMKLKKVHWGLTNLPYAKSNAGSMWPDGWRISRVSKNRELAWEFVKFLCSPESLRFIVTNQKDGFTGSPAARRSVFTETLGKNISEVTGLSPSEVYRIHTQGDESGIIKYQETICLDRDMAKFVDPLLTDLWNNRVSPIQCSQKLDEITKKRLPDMIRRWVRNMKSDSGQ